MGFTFLCVQKCQVFKITSCISFCNHKKDIWVLFNGDTNHDVVKRIISSSEDILYAKWRDKSLSVCWSTDKCVTAVRSLLRCLDFTERQKWPPIYHQYHGRGWGHQGYAKVIHVWNTLLIDQLLVFEASYTWGMYYVSFCKIKTSFYAPIYGRKWILFGFWWI